MNAEKQILAELPQMAARATSLRLRRLFEDHQAETRVQIDRLRLLADQLNEPSHATPGGGIAALIEDAHHRLDDAERGEILDAALIAAAQHVEHYEMAAYGTARSYAYSMGDHDAVRILQQTLDEEGHMDHALTRLAERGINQAAGDDLVEAPTRYRSRLRYVAARDLPDATARDAHLHNRGGEHLGTLDGFIVDSASGQPIYYVIDSRGWFAGRRYVVPVGQIEATDGANTLHTTLSRAELARYPEFSPSAFSAMDDRDAIRYERRLHRMFAPDVAPYDGRPNYENLPVYRTPSWLKTGVWMSDASGNEERPPQPDTGAYERTASPVGRADSAQPDMRPSPKPETTKAKPDSERLIARDQSQRDERTEPDEPRIERYRER